LAADQSAVHARFGRIEVYNMRKVDGWQTLATKPIDQLIDLAA
jgi:hypothetical protein